MKYFFALLIALTAYKSEAAVKDTAFAKVADGRALKIVDKMTFTSSKAKTKVINEVSMQYQRLHEIYDWRDSAFVSIKANGDSKGEKSDVDSLLSKKINLAHGAFLKNLSKMATDSQIIQIKDGMTYGVVPLTYNAYLDMLPQLTEAQKKQIYAWLVEAREHAMDAESSDKKHSWFGKYKGRVNNYLSAAGIDMKAEGEKWQQRIKERNTVNK